MILMRIKNSMYTMESGQCMTIHCFFSEITSVRRYHRSHDTDELPMFLGWALRIVYSVLKNSFDLDWSHVCPDAAVLLQAVSAVLQAVNDGPSKFMLTMWPKSHKIKMSTLRNMISLGGTGHDGKNIMDVYVVGR